MLFFHDSSFVDKQFDSCMAVFPSGINDNANLAITNLRIKYYLYGASYEFDIKPPTCTSYTPDSLQNVEITMICEDNKGKTWYNIMLLLLIIQERCVLLPYILISRFQTSLIQVSSLTNNVSNICKRNIRNLTYW